MKNTIRIKHKSSAGHVSQQAKIKTPAAPAEFKIIRLRECPVENPTIETPPQVADFWRKHVVTAPWFKDDKECLCVFLLNTRDRLIGFESVCQGTLDTLLMHPREVLRPATVHNAAAIIIAHNHPSGDPTPSNGDVQVTRNLIQAAEVLKIPLLDHVIIGDVRR
jgi:DNA repair protein RadC